MTDNLVDLATERAQRKMLAERAAKGGEAFINGLQSAGQTLADLGWLLAAPVRTRDKELTNGIYQLVLERLGRIVDDAIDEQTWASTTIATTMTQAREVAFAAFAARITALIRTAADEQRLSPSDGA